MYIANELKQTKPVYELDAVRASFMDNLFEIVEKFFSDKSLFSPEDFTFYINDEHILNTDCNDNIFTCIYMEINQPNNYKPDLKKKKINLLQIKSVLLARQHSPKTLNFVPNVEKNLTLKSFAVNVALK